MAVSFNSVVSFISTTNNPCAWKVHAGGAPNFIRLGELQRTNGWRYHRSSCLSVANSDKIYIDTKEEEASGSNGSSVTPDPTSQVDNVDISSEDSQVKKTPLTVREKLRAARVLSRYGAPKPKPNRAKLGSSVLDALKESDKGRRSGLPEAPTNLLDDSKRGMPKAGLTFDLPGGRDLLIIAFSFVFISTAMFATTFLVWKLGAIHFNDN